MYRFILSVIALLFFVTLVSARPIMHCTSGGSTFTASVIWTGATEQLPFLASFYANTGECINITCADPNDNGDMWLNGPAGTNIRDLSPSGGNLEIETDLGTSGDEGWHTFQMYTDASTTENFSCTCTRTTGGC